MHFQIEGVTISRRRKSHLPPRMTILLHHMMLKCCTSVPRIAKKRRKMQIKLSGAVRSQKLQDSSCHTGPVNRLSRWRR